MSLKYTNVLGLNLQAQLRQLERMPTANRSTLWASSFLQLIPLSFCRPTLYIETLRSSGFARGHITGKELPHPHCIHNKENAIIQVDYQREQLNVTCWKFPFVYNMLHQLPTIYSKINRMYAKAMLTVFPPIFCRLLKTTESHCYADVT